MHLCKSHVEEFVLNWMQTSQMINEVASAVVPFTFTEIKKIQPYLFKFTANGNTITQAEGVFYFGDVEIYTFFDSPATAVSKIVSFNYSLNGNSLGGVYVNPVFLMTGEVNPFATLYSTPNSFKDIIFDAAVSQGDSTCFFRGWKIELK